ncbi:MAG: hypothetical protein RIQ54_413 [Candidatus Parcubacteria bacterium]|jgi:hypothetical protein
MGIKLLNIYVIILIVAILVGAVGLYFAFNDVVTPQELVRQQEKEAHHDEKTEIAIVKKSKEVLTLLWNTLAGNTEKIIIYRFSAEHPEWVEWKTITLEQQKTNKPDFIDILLGTAGTSSEYLYYVETVSATGTITFTSPVQEAQQTPAPSTTNATLTTPTTPQTPPTDTSTQSIPPISNNTPVSQTTTSSPTAIYYTPNGTPITHTTQQYPTEPFWVVHADTGIEIGWQNMPVDTVKVAVYRKKTATETGMLLLTRGHTVKSGINFIRIVDDSVQSAWYYTLEAKDALGTTVGSFGPIYLPARQ